MNTIIKILIMFLASDMAAQSPGCSAMVRWQTDTDQIRSGIMVKDQKIVDELGRGISLGITGGNLRAVLSVKLLEPKDCIPPGAKMTIEFDDKAPLTLSFPTNIPCMNSAKIVFMDLDINDNGKYQIGQFRRFRYSKIKNITIGTNSKILSLLPSPLQRDYILNSVKCMLSANE